jgi:hypothetical protein
MSILFTRETQLHLRSPQVKAKNTVTLRVRLHVPDGIDTQMLLSYVRAKLWEDEKLMGMLSPADQQAIANALRDEKAAIALVQKITDYE